MGSAQEVADRALAAFRTRDAEAFSACYTADGEIVSPWGVPLRGHEGARQFLRLWYEGFPDATLILTNAYVAGPVVIWEAIFDGTHTGLMRAPNGQVLPPTGRHVRARFANFSTVQGDRIASHRLYWDQVEFLTQLGLMPGEPARA